MPNSFNGAAVFSGFASPTSNTTYTPNQFFDVCLPHRSRGCVRIVAYMLRKTLGWSDAEGNPIHEQVATTYDDLIRHAGVSREMIKDALDEAMNFGFITCLRKPSPKRAGSNAVSGLYELRWDEGSEYIKDPAIFSGFFAGEGNRSYIPNEYFDVAVRTQTLLVAKVVGSIARFSIGFVNKFGHRRTNTTMSFMDLRRYARISDTKSLAEAIRHAVECNFIHVVEQGYFDKTGRGRSAAATYAIRWLNDNMTLSNGQKIPPGIAGGDDRSEKAPGIGQKSRPADRSENPSDIQITTTNKTLKQQPSPSTVNTVGNAESAAACFSTLKAEGFDEQTAKRFAAAYPIQLVLNQIEWLPMRGPAKNRLGLLRRAIEQNYPKPESRKSGRPDSASPGSELRKQLAYKLTLKPR